MQSMNKEAKKAKKKLHLFSFYAKFKRATVILCNKVLPKLICQYILLVLVVVLGYVWFYLFILSISCSVCLQFFLSYLFSFSYIPRQFLFYMYIFIIIHITHKYIYCQSPKSSLNLSNFMINSVYFDCIRYFFLFKNRKKMGK